MSTTSKTTRSFVDEHHITLEIVSGPDYTRDDEKWEHHAYTVRLDYDGRSMETPWKQGLGITDDPDAASVLEALASDAAGVNAASSFEDWADEYGYDHDSRRAEATYRACQDVNSRLRELLGDELADELEGLDRL